MGRKISGNPRFDHIQLMKLSIERCPTQDKADSVIAYIDSKTHEMFGSVTLAFGHLSKDSKELLAKLYTSIEDDAASIIFNENRTEHKQEGVHEPTGIVDAEEDSRQV
jgi:hypothetical protein